MNFNIQLSGSEVGSSLADNSEEMFYALEALARETDDDSFGSEVAEYAGVGDHENISAFLRNLADHIDAAR